MHRELLLRIFDHVESGDVDKAVRASLRLSRHIGDHLNSALFLRELLADKKEVSRVIFDDTPHLKKEAHAYLLEQSFERWLQSRTLPFSMGGSADSDAEHNVFVTPIGEFPGELAQLEKSIQDLVVPATLNAFDSAAFTDRYDERKAHIRLRIKAILTIKDRVLSRCFNFAVGVERQLAAQAQSIEFLREAQNEVQNYFKTRSDEVYEKLLRANKLIASTSAEDHSLLLTAVRRAIKSVADYFYPTRPDPVVCSDGKERVLGDDQYLNRLRELNRPGKAGGSNK